MLTLRLAAVSQWGSISVLAETKKNRCCCLLVDKGGPPRSQFSLTRYYYSAHCFSRSFKQRGKEAEGVAKLWATFELGRENRPARILLPSFLFLFFCYNNKQFPHFADGHTAFSPPWL